MSPAGESVRRQTAISLILAQAIVCGWLALHVWAIFLWRPAASAWLLAPLVVAAQSWLGAGMFIVAHDAIHGSLAPGRPRLNRAVGQACVALYAGFDLRKLAEAHGRHHAAPGTADDPDFDSAHPTAFGPWFLGFFRHYFRWPEFARVTGVVLVYLLLFRASPPRLLLFWALPALLSAAQLFTFGTFLPHRHAEARFHDHHRARTLDYSWIVSLLTCFHFGRHLEHHTRPDVPWWRLPAVRV